ncbi:MAG: DEAD/DEAH box helicase, partial [Planctomycetota bacterium]
ETPLQYRGLDLDGFQRQAIEAIQENRSVIVAAPTGAGKTLIAEYALDKCLAEGKRAVYTAPIKALSNQKFRDFGGTWGEKVGILTGDVTIHPDAQVLIMTTEIFRNTLFESPERLADLSTVIFDEIHFLDDPERGTVWEESIIFAPPGLRFVFLSATISNLEELSGWIEEVRGESLRVVREADRPVPLHQNLFVGGKGPGSWDDFRLAWREEEEREKRRRRGRRRGRRKRRERTDHVPDLVEAMVGAGQIPAIVFSFSRAECEDRAALHAHLDLLQPGEKAEILASFDTLAETFDVVEDRGVQDMRILLGRGVGFHHAGLLPTLKEIVERLFTTGKVKLLFTTDTFALGVNMPAKAVALSTLWKFDGVRRAPLKSREFHQMAGRAGRRGIDEEGHVWTLVDPERDRYDPARRAVEGVPEDVNSRFSLSYAALLALFGRLGEADLYRAVEKSFAAYQKRTRNESVYRSMLNQVRSRLAFLRSLRYIRGDEVSATGKRAALLYGYEIQVAELYRKGVFHNLDASRLAALFSALVFEEKPRIWHRPPPRKSFGRVRHRAAGIVRSLRAKEKKLGIRDPMKEPVFSLVSACLAWARGAAFRDLEQDTFLSDGDLVRTLRMTIQLLRQTERAYADDDHLVNVLRKARERINRGVVDAERQLRQGAGLAEE